MSQIYSESLLLFAIDAETGEVKWIYTPQHSVRNNTIAIGAGRIHFIDRPIAYRDRYADDMTVHTLGTLITLDAITGEEIWCATENIYGTMLALDRNNAVLVMGYQVTRFRLSSEQGGHLAAFDAANGNRIWEVEAQYVSRLIMNGDTIYAQSGAWDLNTGACKSFPFSRSYGCGTLAGSTLMFAYRSATLGYWDITADRGTENYGGIRPGCWINAIPAGGLLLLPESSNRCTCSYLIKATIALQPYGIRAPIITPSAGTYRDPVTVELIPDSDDQEIRYTLDGAAPVATSTLYSTQIRIDMAATVQARAFSADHAPSQIIEATFIIDPDILLLDGPRWTLYDSPGGSPTASQWEVKGSMITELSNLCKGDASNNNPETERPGTMRIYTPEQPDSDGTLTLEIASEDDDGLGVAFRLQDTEHYYLWYMDRQRAFRVLTCKNGDEYRMLSCNHTGYESNHWYKVAVVLKNTDIAVYLDGELECQVTDETLHGEDFALYSWGCTGAKFRNVKWEPKQ